jgi:hypothetical protein
MDVPERLNGEDATCLISVKRYGVSQHNLPPKLVPLKEECTKYISYPLVGTLRSRSLPMKGVRERDS